MILAALAWFLPSCGNNHTPTGPVPFGALYVNGIGLTGNVETGSVRIYNLWNIKAGNQYLLRATIAPGGKLHASIYTSIAAYESGTGLVTTATATVPTYYEASFNPTVSGEFVVVLSGTPAPSSTNTNVLNFYDLRLMSATDVVLKSFTTIDSVLTVTGLVRVDEFSAISGTTVPASGTYTVLLTSSTLTISHPQMFIYGNPSGPPSLLLSTLLYSAIATTDLSTHEREFLISTFSTTNTSTVPLSSYFSTSCSVSNVSFVSGTGGGPFIMVQGVSRATYTLTVAP